MIVVPDVVRELRGERVSAGLLATRVGLQPVGGQMLAVADRVAA
jgi:hypothetical protein